MNADGDEYHASESVTGTYTAVDRLQSSRLQLQRLFEQQGLKREMSESLKRLRLAHSQLQRGISHVQEHVRLIQQARHPERPRLKYYLNTMIQEFCELHGDHRLGDDPAIVTGLGRINGIKLLLVGHNKGESREEKDACHWGAPYPKGLRKALLKMKLAEKFNLPIVCLVDTPGLPVSIEAESHGQAYVIATNLRDMSRLRVPVLGIIIGEGGAGGLLSMGPCDRLAMMEYAYYSDGLFNRGASVSGRYDGAVPLVEQTLYLASEEALRLHCIDDIIPEPVGGAHQDPPAAATALKAYITQQLYRMTRKSSFVAKI